MGALEGTLQENSFVLLMVIGILIMLALAFAFVLFANSSQKKIMAGEIRHQLFALKHQEELLHSTILTQEAERKRIARELHDEIGSKLNVILLNIHHFNKQVNGKAEHTEIIHDMKSLINKTIDTTRRISHDLLPPTLEEFGLVEAIKELRDSYQRVDQVLVEFELLSFIGGIEDKIIELNLFRVIQELLKNSIVHGKSNEIQINLWIEEQFVKLEYRDNGVGFDVNEMKHKKGLGRKNIESRLNMINATCQYESSFENGMYVKIELEI